MHKIQFLYPDPTPDARRVLYQFPPAVRVTLSVTLTVTLTLTPTLTPAPTLTLTQVRDVQVLNQHR